MSRPGPAVLDGRQGTALQLPGHRLLSVITGSLAEVRRRPGSPRKQWYLAGATAHGQLAAEAAGAGVTLLAGTDSRPCGRVLDEESAPWPKPEYRHTRRAAGDPPCRSDEVSIGLSRCSHSHPAAPPLV